MKDRVKREALLEAVFWLSVLGAITVAGAAWIMRAL